MNPNPKVWGLGTVLSMHANVYTRGRKREHIGSIWSRVTCLALRLAAAQSLARWAPKDSWSLRRLTVAIRNKQHKQIVIPGFDTKTKYLSNAWPGSIVPHIRPKVFTDNQMPWITYNYYYINSISKDCDDSQWNGTMEDSITPQERQPGQHVT
jgi:hypothetical protein